jgi:hypothetical protein
MRVWLAIAGGLWLAATAAAEPVVRRPVGEPILRAEDDRATIEAWAELPTEPMDLLGRFEAVVEVRADAGVRIDGWTIDDAFGDALLVTVIEAQELERGDELGGWFGRYAVLVEPLIDGDVGFGPLRLSYLVDPDPETDPTQLEPVRTRIESEALGLVVRGPGGELPGQPSGAKSPIEPERPFDWRIVLIAGAASGVVLPTLAALVLAARTSRKRTRNEAPQECEAKLDALERVVGAAEPGGLGVNGAAVANEVMDAVREMLDDAYRLGARALSGPELVANDRVRLVLSAQACERLEDLVEASEGVRFAGRTIDAAEAAAMIDGARALARAVASQRRAMG